MSRPEGQPGTVWCGKVIERWGESYRTGFTYPAVFDGDTLHIWRDGWRVLSPGFIRYFTPGPEWQERCRHDHFVPWRTCDTEAQCDALAREQERAWGA